MVPMLQSTAHTLGPTKWLLCASADLVLYCEAFLTTYRTFISPEELIKKLQYRYPSQACSLQPVRPFLLVLFHFW